VDGLVVEVQTGPGNANTYGIFISAGPTIVENSEIYFAGDEATMGATNQAICLQMRAASTVSGNYIHNCTYGISAFTTSAAFAFTASGNTIRNMVVGDYGSSDCMQINGNASYDWSALALYERNVCSGYRDDGIDMGIQTHVTARYNDISAPIADANGNSSCIKFGYSSAADYNVAYGNYCHDLRVEGQRNYGLIMTGPSHALAYANIVVGAYRAVEVAQAAGAGAISNALYNNDFVDCDLDCINVYGGATGTIASNNILKSNGGYAISVSTGLTVAGGHNDLIAGGSGGGGTYSPTGDLAADPLLYGPSATPFLLSPGSPAIGAGVYVGDYPDYFGRARPVKNPSIGAVEPSWRVNSTPAARAPNFESNTAPATREPRMRAAP
jgi:hypothetical protein